MPNQHIKQPSVDASYLEILEWVLANKGSVQYLEADIKYMYSSRGPSATNNAQVYIIAISGIDEYLAIVPAEALAAGGSEDAFGRICRVTYASRKFSLFMVHYRLYQEALRRIWVAAQGGPPYCNPTTKAVLHGWTPSLTSKPRVLPQSGNHKLGHDAIRMIIDAIQSSSITWCRIDLNEIAPLLADYCLRFDGFDRDVLIESKAGHAVHIKFDGFDPSDAHSPMHPGRQFHFLFLCVKNEVRVVPCHYLHLEMSERLEAVNRHRFQLPEDITVMLETIRTLAPIAFQDADDRLQATQTDLDVRALVSMSALADPEIASQLQEAKENDSDTEGSTEFDGEGGSDEQPGGKKQHNAAVREIYEWAIASLNSDCCKHRKMVVLPLDPHHPLGNTVVVQHDWSDADCERFIKHNRLPFDTFGAADRQCVPIDFWYLSNRDPDNRKPYYPLWMNRKHWIKPACYQNRLIIGPAFSTRGWSVTSSTLRDGLPWLVLPSSFTTLWSKGTEPTANLNPQGHQGGGLVRRHRLLSDITIDDSIETGYPHIIAAGSRFVSRKDVDPRRHMLSFRDIYRHLYRILYGNATMSVDNIQGGQANPTFETKPYRIDCEELHQSLWRHGGK